MICPYCNSDMKKGMIHSDRYALKWIPEERDKGALFAFFQDGIKLTNISQSYIIAFYCEKCKKIIFDVDKPDV